MANKMNDLEVQFIEALTFHIPFDGWSEASMVAAAQDCNMSMKEVTALFPKGMDDVISAANALNDRKMIAHFMEKFGDEFDSMPVHLRIRELIIARLEIFAGQKEVIRKTMSHMAQPKQAGLGSKLLYRSLDAMWRTAGDRSTDFNFYTKRASLGAVYGATLLAFLADESPDMAQTKAFLDRRLKDVAKIPKVSKPVKKVADKAFDMLRRILPQSRAS